MESLVVSYRAQTCNYYLKHKPMPAQFSMSKIYRNKYFDTGGFDRNYGKSDYCFLSK